MSLMRERNAVPLDATEALVGREGTAPALLDHGTKRDWAVSITTRPRFPLGKGAQVTTG
jgi:hypothetical protein